jgi:hypothetical protein
MSRAIPLLFVIVCGCAPYAQVQSQLVEQTRRGVDQLQSSLNKKSQIVREYHAIQRKRLDDAFDADVRERPSSQLTSDWVIEHRRAYSTANDLLDEARFASQRADESDRRTVEAVRAALERLQWLQLLPQKLISNEGNTTHE